MILAGTRDLGANHENNEHDEYLFPSGPAVLPLNSAFPLNSLHSRQRDSSLSRRSCRKPPEARKGQQNSARSVVDMILPSAPASLRSLAFQGLNPGLAPFIELDGLTFAEQDEWH